MRKQHNRIFIVGAFLTFISLSSCYGKTHNTMVIENPADTSNGHKLTKRHSYELQVINSLLKQYHYKKYKLDDAFSGKILDSFIDELDPGHLYLLQTDIDAFNQHRDKIDDYIRAGNTAPALAIFTTYQQRVKERSEFAIKRLAEPFDFTLEEEFLLDHSKEPWAKNKAELDDIWRKRIKNDLINQQLADKTKTEAEIKKSLRQRYANINKRTEQITSNEIFQMIANAYASTLEPHTSYFSPRASEEFNIQMRLSLDGIGAVLRTDNEHTKIVSVVPGGPADRTHKLKAGDRIIGVGQGEKPIEDVIGWRLSDVVGLIRGKKGSTVVLSVLPVATGLSGKAERIAIVRDKIKLEHQAASKRIIEVDGLKGKAKVGVISLPSFYIDFDARAKGVTDYRSTTRDVKKLIVALKKEGIDELIIDLRGNGGGSLSEVISLTGLFIDKGPVVQVKDLNQRINTQKDKDKGVIYDGPLAVMVNSGSASASEIFAGAIKDYKRGLIVGETTFGKGTVQTILPLDAYARSQFEEALGQIKVTTAQFFRVNGDSTQHKGVVPDIVWDLPKIDGDFGERSLKNALEWKHIAESDYQPYPKAIPSSVIGILKENSNKRIKNTPKYVTTIRRLALLTKAGNEKTLSLNLKVRKAKREQFNAELLKIENQLQVANGLPTYKTIKELQDASEARNDDIFNKNKKPVDVFINETAHILDDARVLSSRLLAQKITQANK
ncbi:MAG TPA: tail-specific protease [Thiothrix sp.]|nr:tail-specific protease [Thiothrix sp.]